MSRQYTPPAFSAFGKSSLFQVYDKDSLDHNVKLVNKSKSGLVFEPSIIYAPKSLPRGVVKASFTNNQLVSGVQVDVTVQTDASKASSIGLKKKNVAPKSLPGLNVSLTETTSEKDFSAKPKYGVFSTLGLDYSRNNFAASTSVISDADANLAVSAAAAVGFEGFSVGGDVKLVKAGEGALAPKSYNAGVAYSINNFTGALVSDSKFEKIKATLLASKVGAKKNFNVGLQAKVDLQQPKVGAPQREVILAFDQVLSANTSSRFAFVNTGVVVGQIEHRLRNPDILVSASGVSALPASAFGAWPVTKFGVSLTVGDY